MCHFESPVLLFCWWVKDGWRADGGISVVCVDFKNTPGLTVFPFVPQASLPMTLWLDSHEPLRPRATQTGDSEEDGLSCNYRKVLRAADESKWTGYFSLTSIFKHSMHLFDCLLTFSLLSMYPLLAWTLKYFCFFFFLSLHQQHV